MCIVHDHCLVILRFLQALSNTSLVFNPYWTKQPARVQNCGGMKTTSHPVNPSKGSFPVKVSLHPHHCLTNHIWPTCILCKMGKKKKMASLSKSWWLSSQGSFRVTIRSQIAGHRCIENQSQSHTLHSWKSCLQPLQWQKVKVVTKKSPDRLQWKFSWKTAHASAS